ncbi:hypothetical protein [Cryobacterium sp. MLB-32]|uniref:hypothetical protein n=1 Tax=Cryobacterium sp. MLB-32 TaxID=1529318 RepID=UPI000691B8D2|nr:hypothetical protein [Cryobacterium sp. MLB-32]
MSDTTPNHGRNESDGDTTPETDATPPVEPAEIDYSSAAAREPENFTGTGSHSAVPALADDYAVRDDVVPETVTPEPVVSEPVVSEPVVVAPVAAEPVAPAPVAAAPTPATEFAAPAVVPVVVPVASGAETAAYPAGAAASSPQSPIYVQAPQRPVDRSNRGVGVLIALLATAVFTGIYAIVIFIIAGVTSATLSVAATTFTEFAVRPVFYIPVLFFFLAFALLVVILNRSGWWAYVLFGFLVGVVVYFSYIGGALLTVQAWNLSPAEASRFLSTQWLNPGALAAGIIAREVPIWAGAWIARRGKRVTARNIEARHEYERLLAEGPQLSK